MLRSAIGAAATTALLAWAAPAQSLEEAPLQDGSRATEIRPEWGATTGTSGALRRGCKKYTYGYALTPPAGDWMLEITIRDPDQQGVGGGAFFGGQDPERGTSTYTLCRSYTRTGRFTIEARLSVDRGPQGYVEGFLPPSQFTLHKARRR